MKVGVVGSSGAMGSLFARYFLSRGDTVTGSDVVKRPLPGMAIASSNREAAKGADLVLVATPMRTTLGVCRGLAGSLRKGSTLVELTSIKNDTPERLRDLVSKKGAHLLSIHPLFGPSLAEYQGMKLCVVREKENGSTRLARRLFPEATLFSMTSEEHDRLMGLMLSLTHIVNIAYAKVVSEHPGPSNFKALSTPSSFLQGALAEGVLSQDPSLVSSILFSNRFTASSLAAYAEELSKLERILESGEEAKFRQEHRKLAGAFSVSSESMKKVYRAVAAVKSLE